MSIFKVIWRNHYIIHDLLAVNHNDWRKPLIKVGYLRALIYNDYLFGDFYIDSLTAIYNGNLPVLKWLFKTYKGNMNIFVVKSLIYDTMIHNKIEIMKWLILEIIPMYKYTITDHDKLEFIVTAGREGYFAIVQWLYDYGCKPNDTVVNITLWGSEHPYRRGRDHDKIVKWLNELGYKCTDPVGFENMKKVNNGIEMSIWHDEHCII